MGLLLDKFEKLIVEHGSAAVRGELITLLREQLQLAEKQIGKLEAENVDLKAKLQECQALLKTKASFQDFVEHHGALFKRKPGGGYQRTVYCPNCRRVAATIDEDFPYSCNCGWAVEFTPNDLDRLLKELPT